MIISNYYYYVVVVTHSTPLSLSLIKQCLDISERFLETEDVLDFQRKRSGILPFLKSVLSYLMIYVASDLANGADKEI